MKVTSNLTYVFRCMGVNILPGVNFVENKKFFNHPAVKARIENNHLEVEDEGQDIQSYLDKNAKLLSKEINNIFDIKLLEKIKKLDTRATVIEAIDKQIAKIKAED